MAFRDLKRDLEKEKNDLRPKQTIKHTEKMCTSCFSVHRRDNTAHR
jgi:hypothetical protein